MDGHILMIYPECVKTGHVNVITSVLEVNVVVLIMYVHVRGSSRKEELGEPKL